jgi:hypothetical protein
VAHIEKNHRLTTAAAPLALSDFEKEDEEE